MRTSGGGTGPTRKVIKLNNKASKTGPTRKRNTIRVNNISKTGPKRKLGKLNNRKNNLNNIPNLELDPELTNNISTIEVLNFPVSTPKQHIIVNQGRIIIDGRVPTLQELWFEVFAQKRYDDIINHIIAGYPIDFSTVPKNEDFIHDINKFLIEPSTWKLTTLLKVPGAQKMFVKSLALFGVDSEFGKKLMDAYSQLSKEDRVRLINNLKSYASQYIARPPL